MTTEEIKQAAIVYDRELKRYPLSSEALREDLVKFGQIVNNHWQEKTRWIPVEERLPPRGTETRQVFVKNKNKHHLNWMIVSCFDDDYLDDIEFIKREFTHWKEIE